MRNKSINFNLIIFNTSFTRIFAQINNSSIDQLENTTTITTEDSIVEDKLEKIL